MSGFEVLLAPLNGLLDFFQKNRHHASEEARHAEAQRQEALQAMYIALVATKKYQESNVHTEIRNLNLRSSGRRQLSNRANFSKIFRTKMPTRLHIGSTN